MGVTLRDERAGLEATFLPEAGMLCSSLRHRGEELLAQNRGVEAYVERGKTMGIPLLYPWANRLAGFGYTVAGRTVAVAHDPTRVALDGNGLPIHGVIGGRMRWELLSDAGGVESLAAGAGGGDSLAARGNGGDSLAAGAGGGDSLAARGNGGDSLAARSGGDALAEDGGTHSLAVRLSWDESHAELFEVFPFRHELRYEARLREGSLEIDVNVHADGEDAVPVAFGFHPYLAPGGMPRERWRVRLPAMRSLRLDERQIPVGAGPQLPAEEFELGQRDFDDGFDSVPEHARFAVSAGERRLALEFLEGYRYAQVYAPRDSRFICFEPMTAPANALRSGEGLRVLAPGERARARFAVRCG